MASRLWGLTKRQTVFAFAAAIAVGIVIAVVTTRSDSTPSSPSDSGGIAKVESGRPGARHAVWVFGFQTLRFDLRLRHAQHLPFTGFGAVQGADGRVFMYDAGTGRVGVIDDARNRRTVLGTVPGGRAQDDTFAPVIAPRSAELWIAAAPGALTRFDLRTGRADAPVRVDGTSASGAAAATGVVATSDAVVAVTRDDTGFALTRVDPSTRAVVATQHVGMSGDFSLDGLAADAGHVWLLAGGSALTIDPSTLAVTQRVPVLGQAAGGVRGAVVAAGALWILADHGGSIGRVDTGTGRVDRVVRILPAEPSAFRTPASLVSDGTRVFAMVQRNAARDDHAVRLVGYDARRRVTTTGVDLPAALFAGAAAAS